jgi:hypothetical protein
MGLGTRVRTAKKSRLRRLPVLVTTKGLRQVTQGNPPSLLILRLHSGVLLEAINSARARKDQLNEEVRLFSPADSFAAENAQ